ncbi:glycerol-3-phosphate transporter [Pedobacter boryungensis]|uniref:Glycerol-3-phosphate transporter n=1 Tax=Pedobacter boryungensis TaxID=869962 RepID=A0ABX2DBC0_9SPHI|nr:glycerol-3-phosphate transporter [Pedobacter boryungensis]NQX30879.1 glycerol-3-phosphate transporter [Pedobacter boryungensis]
MSFKLFPPPAAHKPLLPQDKINSEYKAQRIKVFLGIFLGYAGYYFVRKNFSLVMPNLKEQGFDESDLGLALSGVSIAYGLSKFLMGNISDRSNARYFMVAGLILSALTMIVMGTLPFATSSITVMFVLLFLNGWFQGMGWPPSGRVMVHWFSIKERGRWMSIWNLAHNVGGALAPQLTLLALILFGTWQSKLFLPGIASVIIALIAFIFIRDTPQSVGLPPIEEYKNDYPANYSKEHEKELSAKEIFIKYVLNNKTLWYIAIANAFVYLVRYGVGDWAPTYLKTVRGFSESEASFGVSYFELAGIPGTLLCGWLSDKVFKGRRAPATIIFMTLISIALIIYWKAPDGSHWLINGSLIVIGFLIYGPVMLIGVQALDLAPKKAAGTSAGFTGLFGYFLGTALFANIGLGKLITNVGWNAAFIVLLIACLLAIFFTAFTWNREKKNLANLTPLSH